MYTAAFLTGCALGIMLVLAWFKWVKPKLDAKEK